MNKADLVVIASFIATLIPLFWAAITKFFDHKTIYGDLESGVWIGLIIAAFAVNDKNLAHAVIFGFIAGTLIQPIIADPYLTTKTLVYDDKRRLFFKTPIWVASLWGIALSQLYYLWMRMDALTNYWGIATEPRSRYFLFIVISFLYFYIFELIVNNFTDWWWRKNCKQPLGVAIYASFAELFTVAIIPKVVIAAKTSFPETVSALNIVGFSLLGGLYIAFIFIIFCYAFFVPRALNKPGRFNQ